MAKQETWDLKNLPLDRAASYLIAGGSAILSGVILDAAISAEEEQQTPEPIPTEPDKPTRKRKENLWDRAKRVVNKLTKRAKEIASGIGDVAQVAAYGPFAAIVAGYRAVAKNKENTPTEQGIQSFFARVIELRTLTIIGGAMFSAGWALWMSLHPEVVSSIVTALGSMGEAAIDEISEVIDAFIPAPKLGGSA